MNFGHTRPAASAVAAVFTLLSATLDGEPQVSTAVERPTAVLTRPTPMDPDDVAGIVVSLKGPEAGVWVIAETNDLPTKFVRIVVSNEEGRYVLPDLPNVSYEVFARGYGLIDSRRVKVWPGQQLFIGVIAAPAAEDGGKSDPSALRPQGEERNLVMTMWDWDSSTPPGRNSLPGDQPGPSGSTTRVANGAAAAANDARGSLNPPETGDIKALLPGVGLRVPYPKGSFSPNVQRRVDDVNAEWKGRGVWSTFTVDEPDANRPARRLLKLQIRPDPLAR
jgi:hypothetical protein